jgi:ABC-type branched-subunit amino acid transport system substrate-binding protein
LPVDPAAVRAAAATEVVIDAIARSQGTRASVTSELFKTKLRSTVIGPVSFDPEGDIRSAPITVVEAMRSGGNAAVESTTGARRVAVLRPSARLVR